MKKLNLYLFFCYVPVNLMEWFYECVAGISESGSGVAYGVIIIAPPMVGARST